jgi:hypothetical protein
VIFICSTTEFAESKIIAEPVPYKFFLHLQYLCLAMLEHFSSLLICHLARDKHVWFALFTGAIAYYTTTMSWQLYLACGRSWGPQHRGRMLSTWSGMSWTDTSNCHLHSRADWPQLPQHVLKTRFLKSNKFPSFAEEQKIIKLKLFFPFLAATLVCSSILVQWVMKGAILPNSAIWCIFLQLPRKYMAYVSVLMLRWWDR